MRSRSLLVALALAATACGPTGARGRSDSGVPDAAAPAGDAPAPPPDAAGSDARWLLGYYTGHDAALLPVEEIDWAALTHLAVATYVPDGHDGIDESLAIGAAGPPLGRALVAAAHAHGKKIVATLGGPTQHAALVLAASPAHRAAFASAIASLLATYQYDGLDLDWEPIAPADVPLIVALAQGVRAAAPGASLSIPIQPFNMNDVPTAAPLAALVPAFDRIDVMTYGMSGVRTGWKSWHSSPLHWNQDADTPVGVDATVQTLLAAGIPPGQLGIGAGFYGQCYRAPVTGPLQALGHTTVTAVDAVVIARTYLAGATLVWDDAAQVPYLSFATPHAPDRCTYLSYEDARSLQAKAAYARAQGLGGMIVWTINQGHDSTAPLGQRDPLLDALAAAFLH